MLLNFGIFNKLRLELAFIGVFFLAYFIILSHYSRLFQSGLY